MREQVEWFGQWFDSPYYHILYKHRDYEEASAFIDHLIGYFHFNRDHKILDLACGKGRHAIYLNEKGFDVVGIDLSEQNILYARNFENERLHFAVHDMRQVYAADRFDFVLNMFTSFGYFDVEKENEQAVHSAAKALKPGGRFLLDFLNPYTVIHHLIPNEHKVVEGIEFHISKDINDDGYIIKDIVFNDNGRNFQYQERVKAIRMTEFLNYFEAAGLKVIDIFGDYELNAYNPQQSPRMIFVAQK